MVALIVLRPNGFEIPYAYCLEYVAYVRRLHDLIRACRAKERGDVERGSSLHWVLLNCTLHNVHLLRRREIFDHENYSCNRVRAKGVVYFA